MAQLRIDGVPPHIERDVIRKIAVSPGDAYVPSALEERIDELIAKWKDNGYYEVRVDIQETPEPPPIIGFAKPILMDNRRFQIQGQLNSENLTNLKSMFTQIRLETILWSLV